MTILFLTHVALNRYRVGHYLTPLVAGGDVAEVRGIPSDPLGRFRAFTAGASADVVVIQRKLLQPWELWYLRRRAARLVFDVDDAVMFRSSPARNPASPSRERKFRQMVRVADAVIAGNHFLADQARRWTSAERVAVIPTALDLERYAVRAAPAASGARSPVIGWIGSRSTVRYLPAIFPALAAVGREWPGLRFKVIADAFPTDCPVPLERTVWRRAEEVQQLQELDIGVAPLPDDPWSWGKCATKVLQYLAVGVPVVCSPIGIQREIVRDGVEGFWASSPAEWAERLRHLLADPAARLRMGQAGRATVAARYSRDAVFPKLRAALEAVVRGQPVAPQGG